VLKWVSMLSFLPDITRHRETETLALPLTLGHDFGRYDSQLEFLNRRLDPSKPHPFDEEVLTVLLKWLNEHS
jgi:hypothetical protein